MINTLYCLIGFFMINLIILKTTAVVLNEDVKWIFLSSFLGANLVAILPHFFLSKTGMIVYSLGVSIWFICLSFDFKTLKKFLRLYSTYVLLIVCCFGIAILLKDYVGTTSIIVLLCGVIGMYCVVKFVARQSRRKRSIEAFCSEVEMVERGISTKWKAFLDSGNLLFDPLTDKPVNLVNYRVFNNLFGKQITLEDVIKRTDKVKRLKMAHYIRFSTLNNSDSILVFQIDKLKIGERVEKDAVFGLSLKNFNSAFGSDVILHNYYATEWGLK